jgi:hypothetical protein
VTTVEQIAATEALIVDLGTRRQVAAELGEQAKAERGRVALAAAEGDADAQAVLDQTTAMAIKAALDAENLDMAAAAARERLANLQEQAETERLAREREEALAICDQRREAAQRVDHALSALGEAMTAWQATTQTLRNYGRRGQRWLDGIRIDGTEYLPNAIVHAMGYDTARAIGLRHYPGLNAVLPLTETDAALIWARHQRGEAVDTTRPEFRRPLLTVPETAPAAAPDPDDDPPAAVVAALPPDLDDEDTEDSAAIGIGLPDRAA